MCLRGGGVHGCEGNVMIAGGDEGESKDEDGSEEGGADRGGGRRRRREGRHCRRIKSRRVAVSWVFWFLAWLLAGRPCTYACMRSCPHVYVYATTRFQ